MNLNGLGTIGTIVLQWVFSIGHIPEPGEGSKSDDGTTAGNTRQPDPAGSRPRESRGVGTVCLDLPAIDLSNGSRASDAVSKAIPEWERSSDGAKFRHWLRRIAANAILNALTRGAKFPAAGGSAAAEILEQAQSVDVRLDAEIEHEYQRQIYRRAAEVVQRSIQPETWQMFVMAVVDGQSSEAVAAAMQTSIANVHAARSRVMRRLQTAVKEIEESES